MALFNWGQENRKKDLSKRQPLRPREVDATGGLPANEETLSGLYNGSLPELQFASAMAYTPINIPVSLVSIPTPKADGDNTKEAIKELIQLKSAEFPIITRTMLQMGTAWRWVRYDAKNRQLIWESIPDGSITDIEVDPSTFAIMAIYTNERFKVTSGESKTEYIERKRKITREKITVRWSGTGKNFGETTSANPFGHMPIPFGHDCGENEWRGHSVYARGLRTMKASHEIMLKQCQILAEFNPKLIHSVASVEGWMDNNGYTDLSHASDDVFESRMFLNKKDSEKTEFIHLPTDATKAHADAIKTLDQRTIIASGVPEIFWGTLATGNEASVESHKDLAIQYIGSVREEMDASFEELFNNSLEVLAFVNMTSYTPVTNAWNAFDMVSVEVKAKIFQMVASGVSSLVTNASGTKDDVLFFLKQFYGALPEADVTRFSDGIKDMARHKAFAASDIISQVEE
jgi:hypothetical protein